MSPMQPIYYQPLRLFASDLLIAQATDLSISNQCKITDAIVGFGQSLGMDVVSHSRPVIGRISLNQFNDRLTKTKGVNRGAEACLVFSYFIFSALMPPTASKVGEKQTSTPPFTPLIETFILITFVALI